MATISIEIGINRIVDVFSKVLSYIEMKGTNTRQLPMKWIRRLQIQQDIEQGFMLMVLHFAQCDLEVLVCCKFISSKVGIFIFIITKEMGDIYFVFKEYTFRFVFIYLHSPLKDLHSLGTYKPMTRVRSLSVELKSLDQH